MTPAGGGVTPGGRDEEPGGASEAFLNESSVSHPPFTHGQTRVHDAGYSSRLVSRPGQTGDSPATERWWDGKTWTDQTRPVGSAAAWGPPTHPPAADRIPGARSGAPRRGLRTGTAVAAAIAVLAGIGGRGVRPDQERRQRRNSAGSQGPGGQNGGQAGFGGQGGGNGGLRADRAAAPGSAAPAPDPGTGPVRAAQLEDGYATDLISGISIPVPDD